MMKGCAVLVFVMVRVSYSPLTQTLGVISTCAHSEKRVVFCSSLSVAEVTDVLV